ncbi:hypothetical protein CH338_23500 [Rhodoplanes elegans]|uniref:Response regulatory domain-containing protein n=1 Tax=Rhodoplanes elegans TaxID=29408 RepID=A0A327K346_9BRAD|nr:hypothetical protein CH338_23500 [Rhodoplanes elegans]
MCGAYLEQLGYDVRVAASPRDALATLRGADEPNGAGRADDSREARRVSDSGEARRASDSGEARRAHGVDLVLSDILMPGGMSGVDLTRELRALDPGLPVVLMTGFSDRAGEVARDGFPVLRKPFDIGQLERELAAALARPDGSAAA